MNNIHQSNFVIIIQVFLRLQSSFLIRVHLPCLFLQFLCRHQTVSLLPPSVSGRLSFPFHCCLSKNILYLEDLKASGQTKMTIKYSVLFLNVGIDIYTLQLKIFIQNFIIMHYNEYTFKISFHVFDIFNETGKRN